MFVPAYIILYKNGTLRARIKEALALLASCSLCPRNCGVNRLKDELGFCRTGRKAKVAAYNPHFGEEALREMHRQTGELAVNSRGIAERGLLVRHLVMPNKIAGTKDIVEFLTREISPDTYINIMNQYRPCYRAKADSTINSRITAEEYRQTLEEARHAGARRLDRQ